MNTKKPDLVIHYHQLHPFLKYGLTAAILLNSDIIVTDIQRTPRQYKKMGLKKNKSSLHYVQSNGHIHAIDIRTLHRPEYRNILMEIYFKILGFRTLRHIGTADHLHVSLPLRSA